MKTNTCNERELGVSGPRPPPQPLVLALPLLLIATGTTTVTITTTDHCYHALLHHNCPPPQPPKNWFSSFHIDQVLEIL